MRIDKSFSEVCEKIYPLVLAKLPDNIKEQLLDPKYWDNPFNACRIYGKNRRRTKLNRFYPYWDNGVSNYFIHYEWPRYWTVGIHFNPNHREKCSGHIFGGDVRRLFESLHRKEDFQFEPHLPHCSGFSLTLTVMGKSAVDDATIRILADKLSWLIKTTWPKIETIIDSYPVKNSDSCVRE